MSLDSNVQRDWRRNSLKHFTPYPTPEASCVNVFNKHLSVCDGNRVDAYIFPPFSLIGPLLRFLASVNAIVTVVVRLMSPLPGWWPLIYALSSHSVLATSGREGITEYPPFPFKGWYTICKKNNEISADSSCPAEI